MNEIKLKKTKYECGYYGFSPKDIGENIERLNKAVNELIKDNNMLIKRVIELEGQHVDVRM